MFAKLINFMKPLPDAERLTDEKQIKRLYRNWRIKMFFGMYFGYALFYFTRKNLDYVKPALSENFGLSIIELKGGRTTPQQKLDYATGYSNFCQIGEYADNQRPLAVVHAQNEEQYERAAATLQKLIRIDAEKPKPTPEIIEKIS